MFKAVRFLTIPVTLFLMTQSAAAAVVSLDSILNTMTGGFRTSVIHDQSRSQTSGSTVANFSSAISNGTFDTSTGALSFDGTVMLSGNSSTFSASGSLFNSMTRANGVFGNITFDFTGSILNGQSITFNFADQTYTSGGQPNGYTTINGQTYIALWGDTGYPTCTNCLGVDLRIQYSPAPIPLPASVGLLLAGLGGLGAVRRLRKAA